MLERLFLWSNRFSLNLSNKLRNIFLLLSLFPVKMDNLFLCTDAKKNLKIVHQCPLNPLELFEKLIFSLNSMIFYSRNSRVYKITAVSLKVYLTSFYYKSCLKFQFKWYTLDVFMEKKKLKIIQKRQTSWKFNEIKMFRCEHYWLSLWYWIQISARERDSDAQHSLDSNWYVFSIHEFAISWLNSVTSNWIYRRNES